MHLLLILAALLPASVPALVASAQVFPDGYAEAPYLCPPPENPREPQSEAERLELERRAQYRQLFPAYVSAMPATPDQALPMPVDGVQLAQVADTWGAPRGGGRVHQGQDIFAPAGTPVRSAAAGHVYRVGEARLGGNVVLVVGAGGRRYYYAHLSGSATCSASWATAATPPPRRRTCTSGCTVAIRWRATGKRSIRCRCWWTGALNRRQPLVSPSRSNFRGRTRSRM